MNHLEIFMVFGVHQYMIINVHLNIYIRYSETYFALMNDPVIQKLTEVF